MPTARINTGTPRSSHIPPPSISAMERSRRTNTRVKPHDKFAELRALRQSGKKRIDVYQLEQEEDLYEEIDEDEYKKVVRKRLDEDDFVVDDGGEGYVDNGLDDWGNDGGRYDYEDDEEEAAGRKLTAKEKKRKREEQQERKNKQEGELHKYFNKGTTVSAKPKVRRLSTRSGVPGTMIK